MKNLLPNFFEPVFYLSAIGIGVGAYIQEMGGMSYVEFLAPGDAALSWSEEAEQRIARVPGFVRKMVRKRVEADVRAKGRSSVTADDLSRLAKERFKHGIPPGIRRPPSP